MLDAKKTYILQYTSLARLNRSPPAAGAEEGRWLDNNMGVDADEYAAAESMVLRVAAVWTEAVDLSSAFVLMPSLSAQQNIALSWIQFSS